MSGKRKIPNKLCAKCGLVPVQVEHHILPRALGGSSKKLNKQWLCRECHAQIHPYLRYPKGQRAGIPFFKDVLATYYGKDRTIHEKSKHLAQVAKIRAQNNSPQGFRQTGI